MNLKMNSRASVVNLLELKEKLNTPMNTIMSISLFSEVPVITDNTTLALTHFGKQPVFIPDFLDRGMFVSQNTTVRPNCPVMKHGIK